MTKKTALRTIDHPIYTHFQALYLSFFSPHLYVDVAKRWKGSGVLYLLLLVGILLIPLTWRISMDFNRYFEASLIHPLERLPPIVIQEGKLSLDKPMPYFVKNDYGNVAIVVDTSGSITTIDNHYPDLTLLLTKDEMIYRPLTQLYFFSKASKTVNNNRLYTQAFSSSMNEIFEGKRWVSVFGIKKLQLFVDLMIYPLLLGFYFGVFFFLFLAMALMGQVIAKLFYKLSLRYIQTLRILTVSGSAAVTLSLLSFVFNIFFHAMGALLLLVLLVYFNFALWAIQRDSHKLVQS